MRFTVRSLPAALLVFLLPWSNFYDWGMIKVLLALLSILALRIAITFYRVENAVFKQRPEYRLVLNTLSVSHYVEKVRFCMDYAGIDYEEEPDCGIMGIIFHGRTVPVLNIPSHGTSIANSHDILRYLYAIKYQDEKIRSFLEETPKAKELEEKIDEMGVAIRRVGYNLSFKHPNLGEFMRKFWGMHQDAVPKWQKALLSLVLPGLVFFIKTVQSTEDDQAVSTSKRVINQTIKEFSDLLSDGRPFLLGTSHPTYVDLAFASIIGLYILPDGYGGAALNDATKLHFSQTDWDKENVKDVKAARATPAGKFAMKIYKDFRFGKL